MNIEAKVDRVRMERDQLHALMSVPDAPLNRPSKHLISYRDRHIEPRNLSRIALGLLMERDGNNCYLCGIVVDAKTGVVEHIVPRGRGGSDEPSNLGLACADCNSRKGDCFVSMRAVRSPVYHRR